MRRREFLARAASTIAVPAFVPKNLFAAEGKPGASDRIVIGLIGCGGMGHAHLDGLVKFRQEGRVELAAVCDVNEAVLADAARIAGPGATPYRDYRRVLLRPDIDAVVIATPDHWHAVMTVHGCECGKHVYVEKPSSVTVRDGEAMVAAARKNRRAVQVGAQGRTGKGGWATCTAIRNGIVGKVKKVTCWHYENPFDANPVPDRDPPPDLDWDFWLGPLPWRPFNPRYAPGNFRWLMESGGGNIRDRGAHQFSTILWCMDADKQVSFDVEATGKGPKLGAWDNPVSMEVVYRFKDPDWTLVWGQPGDKVGKTEFGQVFWGENDNLILEWEGAYRPAENRTMNFKVPPGGVEVYRTAEYEDFNMNHKADWFKAIKDPSYRPAVDIEIAHHTANLCNLGNLSYLLGRKLVWDGVKREVVGDEEANRLLGRPQRHPYHM